MKISQSLEVRWPPSVPCLPVLITVLCSISAFVLHFIFSVPIYLTLAVIIPVLSTKLYFQKSKLAELLLIAISTLMAYASTLAPSDYFEIHLQRDNSYSFFKGTVTNVHGFDEDLPWESTQSTSQISLEALKVNGKWVECSGTILVRRDEHQLQFGERITGEGAFMKYSQIDDGKLFNYSRYLKTRHISHWLRIDDIHERMPSTGLKSISSLLYSVRNKIISRVTSQLANEDDRKLLASMFFGYRGLLSSEEKETYRRSGTIHLFAVSGLHIGIAATLFLLILKLFRMDSRAQTVILLLGLGAYVLMTGSPPSAVRAFVMISVWQIARGFQLPSNGINNLAVSATILLIVNPLNLVSAGFLYTFIITTFLVLTYRKSLEIYQNLEEKKLWMGRSGWSSSWKLKLFLAFTCSLSASLASFGLNILMNDRVIPLAMITNIFTGLLAFLSFSLAILSSVGLSLFFTLQELILGVIRFTADTGEFSWSVKAIPFVLIALFYALLFSTIAAQSLKARNVLMGLTTIITLFIGWPDLRDKVVLAVSPSSNVPSIELRHKGRVYLINCSSNSIVRENFHQKVDALILSDLTKDHMYYLKDLLSTCDVKALVITKKKSAYFKRILKEADINITTTFQPPPSTEIHFNDPGDNYSFAFQDEAPFESKMTVAIKRQNLNSTLVELKYEAENKQHYSGKFEFHYSNKGYYEEIILGR